MNTVAECQERMAAAVRSGAWLEYFRARARWHELESAEVAEMPPPEVTTHDGWPEGFAVPVGAARLRKAAQAAGWDVCSGYSRASRKGVRRGEYLRHHFVVIGAQRGSRRLSGTWRAKVPEDPAAKLAWAWDHGMVDGRHVDTVGRVTEELGSDVPLPWPEKVPCGTCKTRGRIVSPAHPLETLPCPECIGAGVILPEKPVAIPTGVR